MCWICLLNLLTTLRPPPALHPAPCLGRGEACSDQGSLALWIPGRFSQQRALAGNESGRKVRRRWLFSQLPLSLVVVWLMSCQRQQVLSGVLSTLLPYPSLKKHPSTCPFSLVSGLRLATAAHLGCCRIFWCFSRPVIQPECVICFLVGYWPRGKRSTYPGPFFLILLRMPLGFHHNDSFSNWCKIGVLHYVQKISPSPWFFCQLHFIFCIYVIYIEFLLDILRYSFILWRFY